MLNPVGLPATVMVVEPPAARLVVEDDTESPLPDTLTITDPPKVLVIVTGCETLDPPKGAEMVTGLGEIVIPVVFVPLITRFTFRSSVELSLA